MTERCRLITEYVKTSGVEVELPEFRICIFNGVYSPKLDSFLLARELMEMDMKDKRVLDVGTGCGILAIIAAMKGAFTVATDIHEGSVRCAEYNASLNNVSLDARAGNLFEPIDDGELFDIVVSNMTSLPCPPNERHDEYTTRSVNAGHDGRQYLDPLINQVPKHLKRDGYFLTQHSNFANIEKTKETLEKLNFEVELKVYEYPVGKTSGQRIDYFLEHLPNNCHPFKKGDTWYQKIGIFKAKKG